ncbi:MAG TPA: biopolymer transporter ExbD [Gemmatimonadales bacterium]
MTTLTRVGYSADINMTPLIDVLLVLFIIFVLLVRSQVGTRLNVPPPDGPAGSSKQIVLELPNEGGYRLNGTPVSAVLLGPRLTRLYAARPNKSLFIAAGDDRTYEEVIEAAGIARGAGVEVVGLTPRRAR